MLSGWWFLQIHYRTQPLSSPCDCEVSIVEGILGSFSVEVGSSQKSYLLSARLRCLEKKNSLSPSSIVRLGFTTRVVGMCCGRNHGYKRVGRAELQQPCHRKLMLTRLAAQRGTWHRLHVHWLSVFHTWADRKPSWHRIALQHYRHAADNLSMIVWAFCPPPSNCLLRTVTTNILKSPVQSCHLSISLSQVGSTSAIYFSWKIWCGLVLHSVHMS